MTNPANIWLFNLATLPEEIPSSWMALLSDAERERANGFKHTLRRNSYIASHAMLYQQLIAHRFFIAKYSITDAGKPELLAKEISDKEKFLPSLSISHSHSYVLCISSMNGNPTGCDIEIHKSRDNSLKIAKNFFTKNEYLELKSLYEEKCSTEENALFYRMWTGKEAWLKAQGLGIANGLKQIEIRNDYSYQINNSSENTNWKLFSLEKEDYTISVAINDSACEKLVLQHVNWSEKNKIFYIIAEDVFRPLRGQ